jgi:hypothetical protein
MFVAVSLSLNWNVAAVAWNLNTYIDTKKA